MDNSNFQQHELTSMEEDMNTDSKQQVFLGLAEVSEMLGVSKQTINSKMTRGNFPIPIQKLKSTPLWTLEQIEKYKETRNKLRKKL